MYSSLLFVHIIHQFEGANAGPVWSFWESKDTAAFFWRSLFWVELGDTALTEM